MIKRDRVKAAIYYGEVDRIPHNIELCSETLQSFCAEYEIDDFFDFSGNHIEKIGFSSGGFVDEGFFRDEFGVVWNRTVDKDIGIIENYLLQNANFDGFKFPQIDESQIVEKTNKFLNNGRDSFKVAKIGMTLYERAWSLRGTENLLIDMYENEDFVHELLNKITDYNLKIINSALKCEIDGFYFGDDYGQQQGLIMGRPLWKKFIMPCLARTFEPIIKKKLPIIFHSCGNISQILDDFIEIGLTCYQTVQPEIYDLKALQQRYNKKLAFYGTISTQQFLPYAKPSEIAPKLKETCNIWGKNGGLICAPTHQVPPDVPNENIKSFIDYFCP